MLAIQKIGRYNRKWDCETELFCNEEINELKARMKESKWPSIVFGKFCALLGAIPIVNQIASPVNAAYTALGSGGPKEINSPLAYAAYLQAKLFHK
jgi:hypothetical protein